MTNRLSDLVEDEFKEEERDKMVLGPKSESNWEINNYGKCINQFPPNTMRSIRRYESINKKICRQKMSIISNEICIGRVWASALRPDPP